jgi:hypothetical protein
MTEKFGTRSLPVIGNDELELRSPDAAQREAVRC